MTLTLDHKSWSQWLHPKNSSRPTVYLSSDTLRSSTEYIVAPEFDASIKQDPALQDDGLISSVDLTPIEELSSPSASSSGGHGYYSSMHPHLSNLDHVSSTIAFRTAAESHSIPRLINSPSRPDARHSFHMSHAPSSSRIPSHSSVVASTSALTGPFERRPRNKLRKPPPTRNTVQRLSFIAEPFSEPTYDSKSSDRTSHQSPPNSTSGYIDSETTHSASTLPVHSRGHILFDPPPIPLPPSNKRTGLFRRATSSNITTTTQKLTKRRPSLPTQNTTPLGPDISSRGNHSLLGSAKTGPSSSSPLLHYTSASTPQLAPGTGERSRVLDRTSSDPVPFYPNIPSVKRNSTLGFSLRRKKKNDPVQATSSIIDVEQGSETRCADKISTFWSSGNHSRRSVSESGHGPPIEQRREWLPRVTASSPFQVTIVSNVSIPSLYILSFTLIDGPDRSKTHYRLTYSTIQNAILSMMPAHNLILVCFSLEFVARPPWQSSGSDTSSWPHLRKPELGSGRPHSLTCVDRRVFTRHIYATDTHAPSTRARRMGKYSSSR